MSVNSFYTGIGIALLVLTGLLGTIAFRLSIPVIAFYSRNALGASVFDISIFTVAFMLSRAASSSLSGLVVERKHRAVVLAVFASLSNAFVVYAFYLRPSIYFYTMLRGLQGVLNGMTWPIVQYLVSIYTPTSIRARVLSIYFMSGSLGGFAANSLYAFISDYKLSSQLLVSSLFFITTSLTLASSLILLRGKQVRHHTGRQGKGSHVASSDKRVKRLGRREYTVILSGFFTMGSTAFIYGEISYVYLSETIGFNESQTALVLAYTGLVAMLASYLLSWFADKVSDKASLTISLLLAVIAPILISITSMESVILGYLSAMIAARSYRPLSRRYLATYASLPATSIGLINASDNIGVSTSQLVLGASYDKLLVKAYSLYVVKATSAPLPLFILYSLPLLAIVFYMRKEMLV